MKIFVTGASGFLGRNLIPHLEKQGHSVFPWIRKVSGDLTDPAIEGALQKSLEGQDVVIHMASKTSQEPSSREHSNSVNVQGTQKLIRLAKSAGVKKFVFVSSQSAKITNPGVYGSTKKQGEDIVKTSGMDFIILRPAIIYGPGEAGIFKKFVGLIEKLPVIPVPFSPVTFQPVFVNDVVLAIANSAIFPSLPRKEYDVTGPDSVNFMEFLKLTAEAMKLKRFLIPVPMPLAMTGAKILSKIMQKPPVTVDNLIGLSEKTPVDIRPMIEELKVWPASLKDGLTTSLSA